MGSATIKCEIKISFKTPSLSGMHCAYVVYTSWAATYNIRHQHNEKRNWEEFLLLNWASSSHGWVIVSLIRHSVMMMSLFTDLQSSVMDQLVHSQIILSHYPAGGVKLFKLNLMNCWRQLTKTYCPDYGGFYPCMAKAPISLLYLRFKPQ